MGHYLNLLDELPAESPSGWAAGAVGKAAIRSLIEGDLWYTYAKASLGSVGGIQTGGGTHGGSTKENQGFLIDVAKAIAKDLIITKTSDLQAEWDMFMAGTQTFKEFYRNTNISLDALTDASSLDDSDKIRRNNPDTLAVDFLAYNLINSSTFASIISAAKLARKLGYFSGAGIDEVFYDAKARASALLEMIGVKDEQDLQALEERFKQSQQSASEAKAASKEDIEKTEQDIKIHMQALLASSLVELSKFNKNNRSLMMPRYSKTYLLDGPPSELVNKLTYVPGSESFINLTVPEASSLVPMIKLWKVRYNSKGALDPDLPAIPLIFKTFTDTDSDFISGHGAGRSGVGIKSFDWQYNGTNPATVKNDITAKLVLYFQNFNDLLKEQEGGFKYVDLLIRSSPTSVKDKKKPIEDQNETDCPENESTTEGDSKHYEIKATVGWAPNVQYVEEHGNPDLATSIRNQQVSLFLTLVEHEFKITQQGTFELTIDYRGRIDGIMMDKRADVILDGEVRKQMSKLTKDLKEAESNCFKDEIGEIKERIEDVKTRAKFESHTKIFQDLLVTGRLYYAKISTDDWDAAGQKIINLKKVDIGIPADGSTDLKVLYKASDDILNKEMQIAFGDRPDVIEGGCGTSYQSTAALAAWYLGNVATAAHADNALTWWNPVAHLASEGFQFAGIINEEPAAWELSQEDSDWWKCFKLQYNTTTGQEQPEEKPLAIKPVEFKLGQLGETYGLREEDGSKIIPYFFLGDLIDIAARKALGGENSTTDESEDAADFHPNRVQNLQIILGCLEIAPYSDQDSWEYINIGDIPVCLPYFRDWWARHTTKSSKNSYPLIQFIRDCLKDFAMEALGDDLFDGQRSQKLMIRDASISVPAKPGGGNPIEDRINKGLDNANERRLLKASRLDLNKIDNTSPMQAVNPTNLTPNDMYFYKVFYLVNDSPDYLNGNKQEDSKKGIQHIVMGSRSGLLKEASFSRSTSPGLREQRVIEESEFNPLSHLADVYNISARMIGNTMFFPGQYIYLNPIGFGTKLGNPADPGSPSRAMGLGGYHLVTQVSSFIDEGKFETTVEALWETSGGPCARRNDRGQKTEKGNCSSDASNTALSSPTPSPESNIELPE
jgi:hypothetical protein